MKDNYTPGQDCQCHAYSESECGCNADWTPKEVYELREKCSNLDDQVSAAMMVIRGFEREIENLKASGIHTCHDQCQRPMCVMRRERDEAREQRDKLADELNEWKTLNGWGGTPEIINDFIKGQQSRIYAAQDAEEQRDRLAEALRDVMKYRRGEKPYDYWRLNENDRGNAQFDGWNEIEDRINEALKAVKG